MKATYEIGGNIWLVVHYEDGIIDSVEDHDHYAGGHIRRRNGMTWPETFIDAAVDRRTEPGQAAERIRAAEFLVSLGICL